MTSARTVTRVAPEDFAWAASSGTAEDLRRITAAATDEDGSAPLDEAALLRLRHHGLAGTALWVAGSHGFAWLHDGALDLVVAPASRGQGLGAAAGCGGRPAHRWPDRLVARQPPGRRRPGPAVRSATRA